MRRSISIIGSVLLAAALISSAWANPGKGKGNGGGDGGGGSQKGGVPALAARVTVLEGQNNFAVVSSACAVLSSSSKAGAVSATPVATGQCEVTFSEDVSACAFEATIDGITGGEISVASAMKVIAGDSVIVYTFVPAGTAADSAFDLTVTCP